MRSHRTGAGSILVVLEISFARTKSEMFGCTPVYLEILSLPINCPAFMSGSSVVSSQLLLSVVQWSFSESKCFPVVIQDL